jgi:hypothetical protein
LNVTLGPLETAPFVNPVKLNGIATANITSNVTGTAGFSGNITGLKTVNIVASMGPIQLGGNAIGAFASEGLNTALTNIRLDANQDFTAVIAAAALAYTNDAVKVTINGDFGTKGAPNVVALGPDDGAAHGYENETFVLNGKTDYLVLSQGPTGNSLKSLTLNGTATATLFANFPNNFNHLAAIDASDDNHGITITGALSGGVTTAAIAGLLATDTALTSLKFGAGNDSVDLTAFSAANLAGLTADGGDGNNTMIVTDAVATTTSEATFANIKDFQILSIGGLAADSGAGGTIDMALLPSSINEIVYQTAASSALIINNQTDPLTIDTEGNGHGFAITVNARPSTAAVPDSLHLVVGDAAHSIAGAVGTVTLFGEESVAITSQGANGNTVGLVTLTPIPGTSVHVTIDGTNDLTIGGIEALNESGGLDPNSLFINIGGGVTNLTGFPPPGVVLPGDSAPLVFGTDSVRIDASVSHGFIMGAGDASYSLSSTAATSFGDTFIGAIIGGNVLGGSIGNDIFSLNEDGAIFPNTIYTDGGADTIFLPSQPVSPGRIEFYAGYPTPGISPGGVETPTDQSITESNDKAQIGWWGIPTGGAEAGYVGDVYAGLPAETGTSADATVIHNWTFNFALDFGASGDTSHTHDAIWGAGGANGLGGVALGLVGTYLQPFAVPTGGILADEESVFPPNPAGPGQYRGFDTNTNLIQLSGNFTGPTAVAQALHDPFNFPLAFQGLLPPGDSAHILIAYVSGSDTHIADLALANITSNPVSTTDEMVEHVSDIAILLGVAGTFGVTSFDARSPASLRAL